jgi:SAM-dependent methyltransferase
LSRRSSPVYDEAFYAAVRRGAKESAQVLAPFLFETFKPNSVIDVGCGEGLWGAEFESLGADVLGIDTGDVEPLISRIEHDLEVPLLVLPDEGTFDVALCLEVAEHLTPGRAETFVEDLCNLAPIVIFSAAIPGQGGTGHLNEQWPSYWCDLFEQCGYPGSGVLRWSIWDDARIKPWYRQNLLVFGAHDLPEDGCPALVHPAMWTDYR